MFGFSRYKSIKVVRDENRGFRMTIPTGFSGPAVRKADDLVLKDLKMRILGAYVKDKEWLVDIRFGNGKLIYTGILFIDHDSRKLFVILRDFLGIQIEIFLE